LKRLGLLGVCHRRHEQHYTRQHLESHVNLPRKKYARGVEAPANAEYFLGRCPAMTGHFRNRTDVTGGLRRTLY
jgi:hypothetical protein